MPAPVLGSFAQRIYNDLAPLAYDDANHNWALAYYVDVFGQMFQIVEDYSRDDQVADAPGWSVILDINRAPSSALAWLAQFVGVQLQVGLSDAAQRARIQGTDGWRRGSPASMVAAAQQYLTGAKTVIMRERDPVACPSQPAYGLTIITYTSQTPDSAKVLAALIAQKPAGIVLNYRTAAGQDYQSLVTHHALYSNVFADYVTYQGIVTDEPGT